MYQAAVDASQKKLLFHKCQTASLQLLVHLETVQNVLKGRELNTTPPTLGLSGVSAANDIF